MYLKERNERMIMKYSVCSICRRCLLPVLTVLILTLPVFASGDTVYSISWAGIELAFPTDYIVVTSDETTGADSNDASTTEDVYLYADWTDASGNMDFTIQVYDFGDCPLEYANGLDSELDADFVMLDEYFRENFDVLQSCWVENNNTRFAFFSYIDENGNYWKSYVTGHYQEYTMLEVGSFGKMVSQEAADIMDAMIDTVTLVSGSTTVPTDTGTGIAEEPSAGSIQGTSDPIMPLDPPQQVVIAGLEPAEVQVPDYVTNDQGQTQSGSAATDHTAGTTEYTGDASGRVSESSDSYGAFIIVILVVFGGIALFFVYAVHKSKKKKAPKEHAYSAVSYTPPAASYTPPSYTPPAASYTSPAQEPDPWAAPVEPMPSASAYRIKMPGTPSAVKYCPGCGAELKPSAAFCGKCGRKLGG